MHGKRAAAMLQPPVAAPRRCRGRTPARVVPRVRAGQFQRHLQRRPVAAQPAAGAEAVGAQQAGDRLCSSSPQANTAAARPGSATTGGCPAAWCGAPPPAAARPRRRAAPLRYPGSCRRKRSQSTSGRKSASARYARRLPSVSTSGWRFGQRMPPPAPPEARCAHWKWRKYPVVEVGGQRAAEVLEGMNRPVIALEERPRSGCTAGRTCRPSG